LHPLRAETTSKHKVAKGIYLNPASSINDAGEEN
jgi:hypothetical protein